MTMTAQGLITRAHEEARIVISETDPFNTNDWLQGVNDGVRVIWSVLPEAFFVTARMAGLPQTIQTITDDIAVRDECVYILAKQIAVQVLSRMPGESSEGLVAKLKQEIKEAVYGIG